MGTKLESSQRVMKHTSLNFLHSFPASNKPFWNFFLLPLYWEHYYKSWEIYNVWKITAKRDSWAKKKKTYIQCRQSRGIIFSVVITLLYTRAHGRFLTAKHWPDVCCTLYRCVFNTWLSARASVSQWILEIWLCKQGFSLQPLWN